MKQAIIAGAILGLSVLFMYAVGTRPAAEKESTVDNTKVQISSKQWDAPPEMTIDTKKKYVATIETSKGTLKAELFAAEAPKTVNNFVFLAKEGFYDGVSFHRIIKDFMVQTGDPAGTGAGGPGYSFEDEAVNREYVRGTLAMANAGPNTNGSQFFIIHKDYNLPKNYTIFGLIDPKDSDSLKTLDTIAGTPIEANVQNEQSKPTEVISLIKVTIEEK